MSERERRARVDFVEVIDQLHLYSNINVRHCTMFNSVSSRGFPLLLSDACNWLPLLALKGIQDSSSLGACHCPSLPCVF